MCCTTLQSIFKCVKAAIKNFPNMPLLVQPATCCKLKRHKYREADLRRFPEKSFEMYKMNPERVESSAAGCRVFTHILKKEPC